MSIAIFLMLALLSGSCDMSSPAGRTAAVQMPTRGLLAYYPFDGDANDRSGNGNDGTVKAVNPVENRFLLPNKALALNEDSSSITIPASGSLRMGSSYSVSMWFKVSDHASTRTLLAKNNTTIAANDYLNVGLSRGSGLLVASVGDGVEQLCANSTEPVTSNIWHHVVIMLGSTLQVWIDGRLDNEVPVTLNVRENDDPITIGSWNGGSKFKGSVDDVRIYDRGLTYSEIIALYEEE